MRRATITKGCTGEPWPDVEAASACAECDDRKRAAVHLLSLAIFATAEERLRFIEANPWLRSGEVSAEEDDGDATTNP